MSAAILSTLEQQVWPKHSPVELIENRVSFAGPNSELSIYDTYEDAANVKLKADSLLYCGMVKGAKIMHTDTHKAFSFLPHESFILPAGEAVYIDFPEAKLDQPTTCLTVEIAAARVTQLGDRMNALVLPKMPLDNWHFNANQSLHVPHTQATQKLLDRMVEYYVQDDPDKDLLIDFCVSELVTRILRHHGREALLRLSQASPDKNGFTCAINWIESNLSSPLDIDTLSRLACMSRSRFYQHFKIQLGCTPLEYQHQRRMVKAYHLLKKGLSVTQVSYDVGYQSVSHFSRRFHLQHGLTPRQVYLAR